HHDSRLYSTRDDHVVCGLGCAPGHSHRRLFLLASARGGPEGFLTDRSGKSSTSATALYGGQLSYPQTSRPKKMAPNPPPRSFALHTNQFILAQLGGTMVRRNNPQAYPPRDFQERARTDCSH